MSRTMKSIAVSIIAAVFCLFGVAAFAVSYNTQSVNGATGLITTPTANVGWQDRGACLWGLDLGYHALMNNNNGGAYGKGLGNVFKGTVSILGRAEIGAALDAQARKKPFNKNEWDGWIHGKFKIISDPKHSLAIGGNFQWIDMRNDYTEGWVGQLYLAYTFANTIFGMPVDTTFVIGKTLSLDRIHAGYRKRDRERQLYLKFDDEGDMYSRKGDIDFSVGFDFDLLPQYLKHYVHWITDFANYSYSVDPMGAIPKYRACGNTGLRIVPTVKRKNVKWNIDFLLTDFFDHNREWAIGTTFGFGF